MGRSEFQYAESGTQDYAVVKKVLGGKNIEVVCYADKMTRTGIIRGKLRKRAWMTPGDTVLVCFRDSSTLNKLCDIVHVYSPVEVRRLKREGALLDDDSDPETEMVTFCETPGTEREETQIESWMDIDAI